MSLFKRKQKVRSLGRLLGRLVRRKSKEGLEDWYSDIQDLNQARPSSFIYFLNAPDIPPGPARGRCKALMFNMPFGTDDECWYWENDINDIVWVCNDPDCNPRHLYHWKRANENGVYPERLERLLEKLTQLKKQSENKGNVAIVTTQPIMDVMSLPFSGEIHVYMRMKKGYQRYDILNFSPDGVKPR